MSNNSNNKVVMQASDVRNIKSDGSLEALYITYFTVMKPVIDIPDACIDFLAKLLVIRHSYINNGDSLELADMKTLSLESRKKLRDELDLSVTRMLYLFARLRASHILRGNTFNVKLLPNIDKQIVKNNNNRYTICFSIPINDNEL